MYTSWKSETKERKATWSSVAKTLWQIDSEQSDTSSMPAPDWEQSKTEYMKKSALLLRRLSASGII